MCPTSLVAPLLLLVLLLLLCSIIIIQRGYFGCSIIVLKMWKVFRLELLGNSCFVCEHLWCWNGTKYVASVHVSWHASPSTHLLPRHASSANSKGLGMGTRECEKQMWVEVGKIWDINTDRHRQRNRDKNVRDSNILYVYNNNTEIKLGHIYWSLIGTIVYPLHFSGQA